jgi:hypothetical protein
MTLYLQCSCSLIVVGFIVVRFVDSCLDLLGALPLLVCPVEAFVMVTSIDFGDFGV